MQITCVCSKRISPRRTVNTMTCTQWVCVCTRLALTASQSWHVMTIDGRVDDGDGAESRHWYSSCCSSLHSCRLLLTITYLMSRSQTSHSAVSQLYALHSTASPLQALHSKFYTPSFTLHSYSTPRFTVSTSPTPHLVFTFGHHRYPHQVMILFISHFCG